VSKLTATAFIPRWVAFPFSISGHGVDGFFLTLRLFCLSLYEMKDENK
jgi:hypothetical protein